ncbi:hypothetical protein COHA_006589 [Chlorella ohadii]|uniref:Uncharacterized protein n=1 Tax=Chlorella ohadii TaxID=2649997 RepID=A0AAD5DPW2_9CHLO|nr:hypothetical protein COHA_006589 [Chlorella ohadii]
MPYPPWRGLPPAEAVHMAAGISGGLVQVVGAYGPDSIDAADAEGRTALHFSAAAGDVHRVRRLLAHGAEVAAPTSTGDTPLALALAGGHTACIREMARACAAKRLSRGGVNALHAAIRNGHTAGVRALLDAAEEEGEAVLTGLACNPAAVQQSEEVVRKPPACLAVEAGQTVILAMLLQAAPCAASARSFDNNYPLHWAVERRQAAAVRLLLQAAPRIAHQQAEWSWQLQWFGLPIHMAARNGDAASIAELLAAAPDTATAMADGLRPLHLAAQSGCDDAVAVLLQAAPAVAAVVSPFTPLYAAAEYGHTQVVRRLLQAASETAMQPAEDFPHQLPLHVAVAGGHVEAVSVLAAAQPAALNQRDGNSRTPVGVALLSESLPSHTRQALLHTLLAALSDAETAEADVQQLLLTEMQLCLEAGNLAAARLLLPCVHCTPALLQLLSNYDVGGKGVERSLFAELAEREPFSSEQWVAVPSPCHGLAAALPAVLERSKAEAGQLVAHLSTRQRQRLRTAALCLHRASWRQLSGALNRRILVEVIAGPYADQEEQRRQEQQLAERLRAEHASRLGPAALCWQAGGNNSSGGQAGTSNGGGGGKGLAAHSDSELEPLEEWEEEEWEAEEAYNDSDAYRDSYAEGEEEEEAGEEDGDDRWF